MFSVLLLPALFSLYCWFWDRYHHGRSEATSYLRTVEIKIPLNIFKAFLHYFACWRKDPNLNPGAKKNIRFLPFLNIAKDILWASSVIVHGSTFSLWSFWILTLLRIRILLFTLMRIRIQVLKIMRIHADLDPQPLVLSTATRLAFLSCLLWGLFLFSCSVANLWYVK
jgi:hypothetical protein